MINSLRAGHEDADRRKRQLGVGTRFLACRTSWQGWPPYGVGVYLREARRVNKDGTVVSYLQLAHNERHPVTGSPVAKVIHSFGRADKVDRAALARLVASISRFLDPGKAVAAAAAGEVEVVDSRRMGAAWVLGRLWDRLEIGTAVRRVAAGRRLDGPVTERVIFALVAQRACEPGSKLAATRWVAERVFIEGCGGFSDDAAYAAMDFLLAALEEIAAEIFSSVAHLLNLDVDVVFVDTTSTYWEMEVADELAADRDGDGGDEAPQEAAGRRLGHSKDHRDDLPQVVIAMAVTRDGIPVRCWTFPGNEQDQKIIRTVKDGLSDWNLRRLVWVADRGSPRPRTGPTCRAAAGTTSTPRSSATPTPRPPRRWPGRAATTRSPGTCGSRRSGYRPRMPGSGPSGSPSATTPGRPNGTGWSASG